jgi:tetratricopeptide (TPR) repeat protein
MGMSLTRQRRKKQASSRNSVRVILLFLLFCLLALAWWWTTAPKPSPRFNYMVIEREGHLFKLFSGETLKLHPKTRFKIHQISTNIIFNRGVRIVSKGFDVNALRYAELSFNSLLPEQDIFQHYRFNIVVKQFNQVIGSVQFVVQLHAEEWLEKADKIIDPSQRIDFLEKANKLMPEDSLIRQRLINEYKHQEHYSAAARMIEDGLKGLPDQDHLIELYDLYRNMGHHEGTIQTLKRLVSLDPSNRDYQFRLAESYEEAGKLDEAIKTYEKVLSVLAGAEKLPLLKMLGFLYAKAGQTEKAVSTFLSAADFDQQDANLYYNLSALYEKLGQTKKANEYLQKAVALKKGDLDNRLVLAERLIQLGELKKAKTYLDQILATKPDLLEALLLKTELLEKTKNKKELKTTYYRILALTPNDETITYNLGLLEYETGSLDKAQRLLNKYLKKHPYDKQVHTLIFDIYQQQKKDTLAFQEALVLLRIDAKQKGLYAYIFDYLMDRNDYKQIQKIMGEGLQKNPDHIALRQYLILTYLKTGDYDKAISEIQEILKTQPENVKLLLQLARLYENQAHPEEALDIYGKVIAISPGHEEAEEAYLRLRLKTLPRKDSNTN